ncbi:hypothetical protein P7K49_014743 [Saguinus oedipus]|uniref:Enkurin domain-containing protein n=1 Tax=Saguinus oedipus TaxID=9490 RepID=A0ABQ9V791_SAGOE|nr:hypothetical protein P7K49_014743 [Saguinus oedipus]
MFYLTVKKFDRNVPKKPAVPLRTDHPVMGIQSEKNFINTNAADVIMGVAKKPKPIYVDKRTGDKHDLEPSGLVPKYINKKNNKLQQEEMKEEREKERKGKRRGEERRKEKKKRKEIAIVLYRGLESKSPVIYHDKSNASILFKIFQDYGVTPEYICKRNEEMKKAQEEYDRYIQENLKKAAMKRVSDEEREAILQGISSPQLPTMVTTELLFDVTIANPPLDTL